MRLGRAVGSLRGRSALRVPTRGPLRVRADDWSAVGPHPEQVLQGRRWRHLPLVRRVHPDRRRGRLRCGHVPVDEALHAGVGAGLALRAGESVRAQVHAARFPWRPSCRCDVVGPCAAGPAGSYRPAGAWRPAGPCRSICAGRQRPRLERLLLILRLLLVRLLRRRRAAATAVVAAAARGSGDPPLRLEAPRVAPPSEQPVPRRAFRRGTRRRATVGGARTARGLGCGQGFRCHAARSALHAADLLVAEPHGRARHRLRRQQ